MPGRCSGMAGAGVARCGPVWVQALRGGRGGADVLVVFEGQGLSSWRRRTPTRPLQVHGVVRVQQGTRKALGLCPGLCDVQDYSVISKVKQHPCRCLQTLLIKCLLSAGCRTHPAHLVAESSHVCLSGGAGRCHS